MVSLYELASPSLRYPECVHGLLKEVSFSAGDVIHRAGERYRDMYLIAEGWLEVRQKRDGPELGATGLGPGSVIGEMGYVQGFPAPADVVARTAVRALVIEDDTLWRMQKHAPRVAIEFGRFLGNAVVRGESRGESNLSPLSIGGKYPNIHVVYCRDDNILNEVMKLRYHICWEEFGRYSPHLDHDKKILRDEFDDFGHEFVALDGGEVIGSLRTNLAREGALGVFEDFYGMRASKNHPQRTAICTKVIIKKTKRGTPAYLKMCSEWLQYTMQQGIVECYIGCEPKLTPILGMLGFKRSGERFYHYELGPNDPMMLNLVQHGKRLARLAGLRSLF
jgi:Cyclic nucleotide-binding domain